MWGMDEWQFWELLASRVNQCWPAVRGDQPGYFDHFEPTRYYLGGQSPRITGRVEFVSRQCVEDSTFTVFLRQSVDSLVEIQWASLLPPNGAMGWLTDGIKGIEISPVNPPGQTPDTASVLN